MQRIVELQPENPIAHANLGLAYLKQNELELSAGQLRRAVELKPDYLKAHQTLVTVLKKSGRLAEAQQHALEAQRLHSAEEGFRDRSDKGD